MAQESREEEQVSWNWKQLVRKMLERTAETPS